MENPKAEDKRCRKTRKAIKTAVAQLLIEKDISKISITEISQLADINRKTFYAHYTSVYDVLDDIEDELVVTLSGILDRTKPETGIFNPMPFFTALTNLLEEDAFYRYLLQATYTGGFFTKVGTVLGEMIIDALRPSTDLGNEDLAEAVDFISGGFLRTYRNWIRDGKSRPLEEVSDLAVNLATSGIDGIVASGPSH